MLHPTLSARPLHLLTRSFFPLPWSSFWLLVQKQRKQEGSFTNTLMNAATNLHFTFSPTKPLNCQCSRCSRSRFLCSARSDSSPPGRLPIRPKLTRPGNRLVPEGKQDGSDRIEMPVWKRSRSLVGPGATPRRKTKNGGRD